MIFQTILLIFCQVYPNKEFSFQISRSTLAGNDSINQISGDTTPDTRQNIYSEIKTEIQVNKFNARTNQITTDSLSRLITNLLVNDIIPHWLGTRWSFEGHTSVPGHGEIACGYFVSTTLLHLGFNLNRYKFAQQLPVYEARTLNMDEPVLEINNSSVSERIRLLTNSLKEGIYFIGFDQSHVGYIQKINGQIFLIHSNYINAAGVVIEHVENSLVFASYNKIYIAEISTNKKLLKKWLLNEAIIIINQ